MATAGHEKREESEFVFDREKALKELDEFGYTVVPNVITEEQCDEYISEYKSWLQQWKDAGTWPKIKNSLIQKYSIAYFTTTWKARLQTKKVFAELWQTEKLLTSTDAVAIGQPPEQNGMLPFNEEGVHWLHIDQGARRKGLHCYQGSLYLEETTETDHCFRVLERSHKYHDEFFEAFGNTRGVAMRSDFVRLQDDKVDWFIGQGCSRRKVTCPKGSLLLWDSRTVHDNVSPENGRPHKDRWRFMVIVCMTPAIWATLADRELKRKANRELQVTAHWSSQGVRLFHDSNCDPPTSVRKLKKMPKIGQTREAKLLMGVENYDFEDGESNGPDWRPVWA